MKKLAFALVCLASVAFFASCDPDVKQPEPTISLIAEDGYAQNEDVVNLDTPILFGFTMASNSQTNKELASLKVTIDDMVYASVDLTGKTEYRYVDTVMYTLTRDEIIGTSVINAVVTDAAGETATATINLSINNPSHPLLSTPFEWYRLGNTQTGLEEFGLVWEQNAKETHAQIKPLEGVTLYSFPADKWEATLTDTDKIALFTDGGVTMNVYNNVSTSASDTYDDVIGTKMADGTLNLIHVTKCVIGAFQPQGYPITISGEAK